ncbi:hypothetical protein [Deinococcus knuensis]|uniref:Uncharacterized protein n=1 Tax=Deinococcus knuensis TaxID=1837380 RepID=A0ABQ2SHF7_9DEIO|nr:hypothetical protein [Deinococcus knuensis]GGS28538.1 hypothetical protein GCM10008961_20230 [Deinococcus knuensis]
MVFLSLGVCFSVGEGLSIAGQVRNPAAAAQVGPSQVRVLLTNLGQGFLVGIGTLDGTRFSLRVPDSFRPPVTPLSVCPGVSVTPATPRTYTAETLLIYHQGRNAAATLIQADDPTDPTRRGQWVFSDRAATLRGRCTGLNTHYDLTLTQGWNAVTTVTHSGRFEITNATTNLPYWVQPVLTREARTTFPALFSGARTAF